MGIELAVDINIVHGCRRRRTIWLLVLVPIADGSYNPDD